MTERIDTQITEHTDQTDKMRQPENLEIALEALRRTNNLAGSERDILRLRREAIEATKQQLEESMAQCDQELAKLGEIGQTLGEEYERRRRELGYSALRYLQFGSDDIADREMLWQVFAEQHLAHYVDYGVKRRYAKRLLDIEALLGDAHANNEPLPILTASLGPNYVESPSMSATIGMSDPAQNTLGISEVRGYRSSSLPHIKLVDVPAGTRSQYDEDTRIHVESDENQEWWLPGSRPSDTSYGIYQKNKGNYSVEDCLIGEEQIAQYLLHFAESEDVKSDDYLFQLGNVMQHQRPLFDKLRDANPVLQQRWSDKAVEKFAKVVTPSKMGNFYQQGHIGSFIKLLDSNGIRECIRTLVENGVSEEYATAYLNVLTGLTFENDA